MVAHQPYLNAINMRCIMMMSGQWRTLPLLCHLQGVNDLLNCLTIWRPKSAFRFTFYSAAEDA